MSEKIIEGTDNFSDYWTDSSQNSSSSELGNSSSKSSGNDDSSGDSEGPGTSVRPFLTLRASPAHHRRPRKSALNSLNRTKRDAGTTPVINNVERESLRKRRKIFNSRSIQTFMKKKAYYREAEDSSPERSVSRSPKRRLILEEHHLQRLTLEKTTVDKSINTSPKLRSGFRGLESRGLPLQIAGTSSDEEGVGSPAQLTAVSSHLQIKRRLKFESPKSVKTSGNDIVRFHDSYGYSEGQDTSVRPFLTARASPERYRSPRKSARAELQGQAEIRNGKGASERTQEKRLRSFVLEKTVQYRSCSTSGGCTEQRNANAVQHAESGENASRSTASLVAETEDSPSRDGAEEHRDETVPAASRDVSSNTEAVCDNGNAPNAVPEKATEGRPRRNRVPPLAHWRNERRRFRYMPNGDIIDLGIDPGTKEDRETMERLMERTEKARKRKLRKTKQDASGSTTDDTAEPAVLLDPVTGEQTEVLLQSRFKRQNWIVPASQPSGKPAYKLCHSLWTEKISFGFVEIAAGCKKGVQYSPYSSLHFVLQKGNLVFHIKENVYKLNTNDSISVPLATPYSIDNSGKTKALLHFCSTTLPLF